MSILDVQYLDAKLLKNCSKAAYKQIIRRFAGLATLQGPGLHLQKGQELFSGPGFKSSAISMCTCYICNPSIGIAGLLC